MPMRLVRATSSRVQRVHAVGAHQEAHAEPHRVLDPRVPERRRPLRRGAGREPSNGTGQASSGAKSAITQ